MNVKKDLLRERFNSSPIVSLSSKPQSPGDCRSKHSGDGW